MRVLIVDDRADVRFLIAAIVRAHGPPLAVAGEAVDAETALVAIDELAPDVVVIDRRLPRIDGLDVAAQLLKRDPTLRIVLFSGLVDAQLRERAAAIGIESVLSKDRFDALPAALLGEPM